MTKQRSAWTDTLLAALPGLVLALAWIWFALQSFPGAFAGQLGDPDSHMVILRLRQLLATGTLDHGFFARDNAPHGMVLHWTAIYELVLLALMAPLAAFVGWPAALAMLAPFVGPLCVLVLVLVACWATAPVLSHRQRRYLGLFVAAAPLVYAYGKPGNATHHLAVVIAWTAFLGFALRVATRDDARRDGLLAGLAAALALWINVECVHAVAAGAGLMMLAWIRDGAPRRAGNLAFAIAFAAATIAAHLVDRPHGGWLGVEIDRLSIVYVTFALLLALVWIAVGVQPQTGDARVRRFQVAAAGAGVAGLCLVLLYPQLLAPRQSVFDLVLYEALWRRVVELMPAYGAAYLAATAMTGPAIAALAALGLCLRTGSAPVRQAWLAYLLVLAIVVVPGVLFVRFAIYAQIVAALAGAVLIDRLGTVVGRAMPRVVPSIARIFTATLWILLPFLAVLVLVPPGTAPPTAAVGRCTIPPVATLLNHPAIVGDGGRVFLTEFHLAPETLYWTPHRSVGGPYHRNREGLRDLARVMAARDEDRAIEVIDRRGVDFILLCAAAPRLATEPFFNRLRDGDTPAWLERIAWPPGVATDLVLYRVR